MSDNPYLDALGEPAPDEARLRQNANPGLFPAAPMPKTKAVANPYLDALEQTDATQKTQLQATVRTALPVAPDQAAKAKQLSSQTGIPHDVVLRNFKDVETQASADTINKWLNSAPTVADRMRDLPFAQMAHDDVQNLSAIEKIAKEGWWATRTLAAGVGPALASGFYGTLETGVNLLAPFGDPLAGTILPENPLRRVAAGLSDIRKGQQKLTDAVAGEVSPEDGLIRRGIRSGILSVGQQLPAIGASVATGNPAFALGSAGVTTFGTSATKALDKGMSPIGAAAYGASDAAIEIATEKLPIARLLGDLKAGSGFFKTVGRQIAAEVPGEQVATALQDFNEWAALNPEKQFREYLKERPAAAAETLIATIVGVGITSGAASSISKMSGDKEKQDAAQANAQNLEQLLKGAEASKLRERDPASFASLVQESAERAESPVADIYIDAQTFAQSIAGNENAQTILRSMPTVAAQLDEAIASGGDLRIPVGELAAAIPGTGLESVFLQNSRTAPDALSQKEAQSIRDGEQAALEKQASDIIGQTEKSAEAASSAAVVRNGLLTQLQGTQRFTDDVNTAYADIAAAFYSTQAERLGLTPEQMFAKYPLQIRGNALASDPRTFSQSGVEPVGVSTYSAPDGNSYQISVSKQVFGVNQKMPNSVLVEIRDPATGERRAFADFSVREDGTLTSENTKVAPSFQKRGFAAAMYKAARDAGFDIAPGRVQTDQGLRMVESLQRQGIINKEAAGPRFRAGDLELAQGERGTFNPNTLTINLLQQADLSTFNHELGHFYLEVLSDIASQPDAPQQIQDDMARLLKWFGVADLATWKAMSLDEQRASHEKFAEGYEQYLFEGRAPTVALQPLFQRFRSWMVSVYKSLSNFLAGKDIQLNEEVRGVYDRLLATDAQIQEAEDARGWAPMFESAKDAGMTDEQFAEYIAANVQATEDGKTELQTRSLKDMKWLDGAKSRALKAMQRDAAEKRKAVRREVEAEVQASPVYAARRLIQRGLLPGETEPSVTPVKLSIPALAEMYGGEGDRFALLDWSKLGYGAYGMLAEEGMSPDVVAETLGFTSGDQMVRAMLEAQPYRQAVEAATDQRMLERYGDLTDGAAMDRAVNEAVHNEARIRFVATELSALDKAMGKPRVLMAAAKQFAETMIARKKIRDIKPAQFDMAEARAAKAAMKALKKGDQAEAVKQKRAQLINNQATRSANKALDEVSKGVAYLKKFDRDGVRKSIDAEYTDQIDALLERFDLRQISNKEIDKRKSLADWVASQQEMGLEPDIPQNLLNNAALTSYRDMPMEDFRGLVDTVKQIEHLGRLKNKLLTAQDDRKFADIRDSMVAGIIANGKGRKKDTRTPNTVLGQKLVTMKNFWASHIKAATWARIMDGGKDGGPMWEYLIRAANMAGDREVAMREKATKDLSKILGPVLSKNSMKGGKIFFPSINDSMNLEARMAVALNVGNASNLQRLLGGEGWTQQQIQPILDSLTQEQWQAVQGVWDYFESYRPEIAAKERRVYGKEPDWIDPTPVRTPYGELKGGYLPIVYDPMASDRAEEHADAEEAKRMLQGAYTSATTRRSFTKSRVDQVVGRPLMYSLDGVYNGVQEVIHDLSWHEYLIDANRLIRNQKIATAMRETYGPEVHRQFKMWLEDVAVGETKARGAGEQALAWIRQGVSISGLGFNVMSAAMQPLGLTQSIVRIGPKWVGRGIAKAIASPVETSAEISEKSTFMRTRFMTRLRELNEVRNQVKGQTKARAAVDAGAYALMLRAQQLVDIPTWWGAYEKAISEGNNDKRAVALADQAVIDSQGGGATKDQSGIERGSPAVKLFGVFYSFFNTALNIGVQQTMTQENKAKLAANYLLLYVAPAVLGVALKDALTPGDSGEWDDGEKIARRLIAEQLGYLFGLIFGLREIGGFIKADITGEKFGQDYTGPAGIRLIQDMSKLTKEASQGEADNGLRKAVVNLAGSLLRLPAAQVNRTITGAQALDEGKTQNPAALLTGFQEPK